jgi:hypothetical protein
MSTLGKVICFIPKFLPVVTVFASLVDEDRLASDKGWKQKE